MGTMLLGHEPTSAAAVRRELAHDLDTRGIDQEAVDTITLIMSELVSNAIRHARISDDSELDIRWSVGANEVVLSVDDASSEVPQVRRVCPEDNAGRGLAIIDTLATDWGYDLTPSGKRVWARIRLAGASRVKRAS